MTNIWPWTLLFSLILIILLFFVFLKKRRLVVKTKPFKKSHFITIDTHKIHYTDQGRGPAMLLIHGIGASTFTWRNLIPLLENHFRLIAIDLLGFGYSSKDPSFSHNLEDQAAIIENFLEKLRIKKAYVVGSSMGGAIALYLALKNPDKYFKAITISPAIDPRHTKRIRLGPLSIFSKVTLLNPFIIKKILGRVLNKKNLISPEVVNQYLRPYREDKNSIICFTRAFDNLLADSRMPHIFKDISIPVYVLWGEKDRITKVKYAFEIEQIIPNAKIHILKEGSHHLMEDAAEWTAKKILEITH